jgi:hypothetical protein
MSLEGQLLSGAWQARCTGCNKMGEYDNGSNSQNNYRQHNVNNKYCGVFKVKPHQIPQENADNNSNNDMRLKKPTVQVRDKEKEKEAEKETDIENYMVADCSGCGLEGEYWLRVYRDQNYYRLHLLSAPGAGPTAGKLCGNYSERARWV